MTTPRIAPHHGPGQATWRNHANCLGMNPDLFFSERGDSTVEAKAVCAGCEVRTECLAYALTNGERFGIWGGTSELDRKRMRSGAVFAQLRDGAA